MTLVYAEKNGLQVRIWADTSTNNRDATNQCVVPGVLKSIVVSHDMCVSFAGSVTGCLDAIRNIFLGDDGSIEISEVLEKLLSHNIEHPNNSDFIVSYKSDIHRISDGNHYSGKNSYWIGDPEAASRFLSIREGMLIQSGNSDAFGENCSAFQQTIDNIKIDTTKGIPFLVVRGVDGYMYERGIGITSPLEIPSGSIVKVESGGSALGGYSYTFMVPKVPGIPVAGIYFPPGKLGYLYMPLNHDEPIQFSAESSREFVNSVEARFELRLHGMHVK